MGRIKSSRNKFSYLIVISISIILFFILELICSVIVKVADKEELAEGVHLNRIAWEQSYRERGVPIPQSGPREGYWGIRLGKKRHVPYLHWVESQGKAKNLFEVDSNGFQVIGDQRKADVRILILGGSVGFGAYASLVQKTYFAQVHEHLISEGISVATYVLAAGAWKSDQELIALIQKGLTINPDVVIFVDGANDLTVGYDAELPYGWEKFFHVDDVSMKGFFGLIISRIAYGVKKRVKQLSIYNTIKIFKRKFSKTSREEDNIVGRPQNVSQKDFDKRITRYIANMEAAKALAQYYDFKVLYVLQPLCVFKEHLSLSEKRIMEVYGDRKYYIELKGAYGKLRNRLSELEDNKNAYFCDCSNALSEEKNTLFSDLWHFSDFGHLLLADCVSEKLDQM